MDVINKMLFVAVIIRSGVDGMYVGMRLCDMICIRTWLAVRLDYYFLIVVITTMIIDYGWM